MPALVHLFAFAVNAPQGSQDPLVYAEDDARCVVHVFTGSRGRVMPQEATLLVGPTVTRETVRLHLGWLQLMPPEHLIVYWNGHGNENGIALADGLLSYRELAALMAAINSKTRTLILDTCHAGAARRHFTERTASGVGGSSGTIEAAWLGALAAAIPGLRLFAAVSENALAHEDHVVRGSRYTYGLLSALRFARGDIRSEGLLFISDVAADRDAREVIRVRWPNEPQPLRWGPNGVGGRLPLMLAQSEQAIGLASVVTFSANADPSTTLAVAVWDRRHVPTKVSWKVTDLSGSILMEDHFEFEPRSEAVRLEKRLVLDFPALLQHPWYGPWLRSGRTVDLLWEVGVTDDHDRELAASYFRSSLWSKAPARAPAPWPHMPAAH